MHADDLLDSVNFWGMMDEVPWEYIYYTPEPRNEDAENAPASYDGAIECEYEIVEDTEVPLLEG